MALEGGKGTHERAGILMIGPLQGSMSMSGSCGHHHCMWLMVSISRVDTYRISHESLHPSIRVVVSLQFVEKDPKLAEPVLKSLLKYWPVTNSQKEVLFIGELEEILEMTQVCAAFRANVYSYRPCIVLWMMILSIRCEGHKCDIEKPAQMQNAASNPQMHEIIKSS